MNNNGYFKNLDSLRFLAFLLVFIEHDVPAQSFNANWYIALRNYLDVGKLGVLFFFVLSGFLITTLLIREKKKEKNIKIGSFYIRRIKRIWPVYFSVVLFVFFIFQWLIWFLSLKGFMISHSPAPLSALPWFIFFAANFYIILNSNLSPMLKVLWSIAVEEQFYLVWPLFVKYAEKYAIKILVFIILLSSFFRYYWFEGYWTANSSFNTLSVMGGLAIGSLGSFLIDKYQKILDYFKGIKNYQSVILYAAFIILMILSRQPIEKALGNDFITSAIYPLLFSVIFIFIVLEQSYAESPLFSAGKSKIMTWLGKISYGLYAYHLIAVTMIAGLHVQVKNSIMLFVIIFITFLLSVLFAWLSYRYMEKPILDMGKNKANIR